MKTYRVQISSAAWRQVMKMAEPVQNKIFDKVYTLEFDPRPSGCKKLKGEENLYRVRVGDYRILYDVLDDVLVVLVVTIGDRKDVYE